MQVPYRFVIGLVILFTCFSFISQYYLYLNTVNNIQEVNSSESTNQEETLLSTQLGITNESSSQQTLELIDIEVHSIESSVTIDTLNTFNTSEHLIRSLIFGIILGLILFFFFHMIYNSKDLRIYIQRALFNANFNGAIPHFKRTIFLNDHVSIYWKNPLKGTLYLKFPIYNNSKEYGFIIHNNHAKTFTTLESLPLKLLLVKDYLKSNSEREFQ